MKRTFALICIVAVFMITGCGGDPKSASNPPANTGGGNTGGGNTGGGDTGGGDTGGGDTGNDAPVLTLNTVGDFETDSWPVLAEKARAATANYSNPHDATIEISENSATITTGPNGSIALQVNNISGDFWVGVLSNMPNRIVGGEESKLTTTDGNTTYYSAIIDRAENDATDYMGVGFWVNVDASTGILSVGSTFTGPEFDHTTSTPSLPVSGSASYGGIWHGKILSKYRTAGYGFGYGWYAMELTADFTRKSIAYCLGCGDTSGLLVRGNAPINAVGGFSDANMSATVLGNSFPVTGSIKGKFSNRGGASGPRAVAGTLGFQFDGNVPEDGDVIESVSAYGAFAAGLGASAPALPQQGGGVSEPSTPTPPGS